MKNTLLYNAAMALVQATKYIRPIDKDFAKILLDKAEEYKNQITIDKELEKEVSEFERRIKGGIAI